MTTVLKKKLGNFIFDVTGPDVIVLLTSNRLIQSLNRARFEVFSTKLNNLKYIVTVLTGIDLHTVIKIKLQKP